MWGDASDGEQDGGQKDASCEQHDGDQKDASCEPHDGDHEDASCVPHYGDHEDARCEQHDGDKEDVRRLIHLSRNTRPRSSLCHGHAGSLQKCCKNDKHAIVIKAKGHVGQSNFVGLDWIVLGNTLNWIGLVGFVSIPMYHGEIFIWHIATTKVETGALSKLEEVDLYKKLKSICTRSAPALRSIGVHRRWRCR